MAKTKIFKNKKAIKKDLQKVAIKSLCTAGGAVAASFGINLINPKITNENIRRFTGVGMFAAGVAGSVSFANEYLESISFGVQSAGALQAALDLLPSDAIAGLKVGKMNLTPALKRYDQAISGLGSTVSDDDLKKLAAAAERRLNQMALNTEEVINGEDESEEYIGAVDDESLLSKLTY